jgi:hypothetical protein
MEYLFTLAHLCHLTAPVVDDLDLADFAAYIDSADAWIAAQKQGR